MSKKLKFIKTTHRVVISVGYSIIVALVPVIIEFGKINWDFSNPKIIASFFFSVCTLMHIMICLETKLIFPKVFALPIYNFFSAIHFYIKGMVENGNGEILFLVINLIIFSKFYKTIVAKFFPKYKN